MIVSLHTFASFEPLSTKRKKGNVHPSLLYTFVHYKLSYVYSSHIAYIWRPLVYNMRWVTYVGL